MRSMLALAFAPFAIVASLAACASDDPAPQKQSTKPATTASPTTPEDGEAGDTSEASSLGPSCTAYLECCEEIAAKMPQLGASCDSTKKSIEDAQEAGASTATYESACKSGISGAQSAGYCK